MPTPDREEMMNAGRWLEDYYRAGSGLQRDGGLVLPSLPPSVDWEGVGAWLFDIYWRARLLGRSPDESRALVVHAIEQTDEWRQRHQTPVPPPVPTPFPPVGDLPSSRWRRDGRYLVDANNQRVVWTFTSAFRLAHMVMTGEDPRPFLDFCMDRVNGVRVLAMAHNLFSLDPSAGVEGLSLVLPLLAERGLHAEIVCLADTRFYMGYDWVQHVQAIGHLCEQYVGTLLEVCNEPLQEWQPFTPEQLQMFLQPVWSVIPTTLGAADGPQDESQAYVSNWSAYQPVHADRSRAPWGQVRHVREQQVLSEAIGQYVVNDEPGRDFSLAQYFAIGALCRVLGLGDTHHSEWGKHGRLPDGQELQALQARERGWATLPRDWWGVFSNYGWRDPLPESPVDRVEFQSPDGRVYASLNGDRSYVVLLHAHTPTFRAGYYGERVDEVTDLDGGRASVWYCER